MDLGNVPEAPEERVLTPDEKSFLLCVERGDVASAKSIIEALIKRPQIFDVNCVDPLGRSALIISVENENIDMIEMLLSMKIKPKDALLVSIREVRSECEIHITKTMISTFKLFRFYNFYRGSCFL